MANSRETESKRALDIFRVDTNPTNVSLSWKLDRCLPLNDRLRCLVPFGSSNGQFLFVQLGSAYELHLSLKQCGNDVWDISHSNVRIAHGILPGKIKEHGKIYGRARLYFGSSSLRNRVWLAGGKDCDSVFELDRKTEGKWEVAESAQIPIFAIRAASVIVDGTMHCFTRKSHFTVALDRAGTNYEVPMILNHFTRVIDRFPSELINVIQHFVGRLN